MEQTTLTNAALNIKERGFESSHSGHDVLLQEIQTQKWTQKECVDILMLIYDLFRNSTNAIDVGCAEQAVSMLGTFGGTNAISPLLSIMREDTGFCKMYGCSEYLKACQSSPEQLAPLKNELKRGFQIGGISLAWYIYKEIDSALEYEGPSSKYQYNLLHFLFEQTTTECAEAQLLDAILCREVPKWRASSQRADNAARMIREHSGNAKLVAFFEGVRSNALAAARAGKEGPGDASSAPVPSSDVHKGADPWSDLLDDLPKKTPWTPPPDFEPPL